MLETKKAHLLDIVEVTEDLPEYGVKRGERGTVVEVLDSPEEAFILEFVDKSGTSSRLAYWVKPHQIANVTSLARDAFEQGIALFNQGKLGEAEKKLKLAIDLAPHYKSEVRTLIQDSFGNNGAWEETIPPLRILLRIDPNDADTRDSLAIGWLNFGVQQAEAGEINRAITSFRRAIAVNPSSDILSLLRDNLTIAYRRLGIQAYQRGDFESTQYYMSHAFMLSPNESTRTDLALSNAHLGLAFMRNGEFKRAIFFFEGAEEAGLMTPELLNNYGAVLAYDGRLDEARLAFEQALGFKPKGETILGNISKLNQMTTAVDFQIANIKIEDIPTPQLREYDIAA